MQNQHNSTTFNSPDGSKYMIYHSFWFSNFSTILNRLTNYTVIENILECPKNVKLQPVRT